MRMTITIAHIITTIAAATTTTTPLVTASVCADPSMFGIHLVSRFPTTDIIVGTAIVASVGMAGTCDNYSDRHPGTGSLNVHTLSVG